MNGHTNHEWSQSLMHLRVCEWVATLHIGNSNETIFTTEHFNNSTKRPFGWDHAILVQNVSDGDIPCELVPFGVLSQARQVLFRPPL